MFKRIIFALIVTAMSAGINCVHAENINENSVMQDISADFTGKYLYSPSMDSTADVDVYKDFLAGSEFMLNSDSLGLNGDTFSTENAEYDFSHIRASKRGLYTGLLENSAFELYPKADFYKKVCFLAYNNKTYEQKDFPVKIRYTDGTEEVMNITLKKGIGNNPVSGMIFNTGYVHTDVLWGSTGESSTGKNEFGETYIYGPNEGSYPRGYIYEYTIDINTDKNVQSIVFGDKSAGAYIFAVSLTLCDDITAKLSEEMKKSNNIYDIMLISDKIQELKNNGYDVVNISGYDEFIEKKEITEKRLKENGYRLYISNDGSDSADGSYASPIKSFERLRQLLKDSRLLLEKGYSVDVVFMPGDYYIKNSFIVDSKITSPNGKLKFTADEPSSVHLHGSVNFEKEDFVLSDDVRIKQSAAGKVYEADISGIGKISEYGKYTAYINLSVNGIVKPLSVYPNVGYLIIDHVINDEAMQENQAFAIGRAFAVKENTENWESSAGAMVEGYLNNDYAYGLHKISSIENGIITIADAEVSEKYRNRRYRISNLLEEVDSEGEWYADIKNMKLYYFTEDIENIVSAQLGFSEIPLIQAKDAYNTAFENLVFENSRASVIKADNCDGLKITGCTFNGISLWAAEITNAKNTLIDSNTVHDCGAGFSLSGGDFNRLIGYENLTQNNVMYNIGVRAIHGRNVAISVNDVGIKVIGNKIYDMPFHAINYLGNDNLIAYNEIYNVCNETNDVSAIYSGRSFTQRGTEVCYNYIHDIEHDYKFADGVEPAGTWNFEGVYGVYLDDALCSQRVHHNIFANTPSAVLINSGNDNEVFDNLAINQRVTAFSASSYAAGTEERIQKQKSEYASIADNPNYKKYSITTEYMGYPSNNKVIGNIAINGENSFTKENIENGGTFENSVIAYDENTDVITAFYDNSGKLINAVLCKPCEKINIEFDRVKEIKVFVWQAGTLIPLDKVQNIMF